MSRRLNVAVLFGGISAEHEVSVISARGVLRALDAQRYDVTPIGIAPNGAWRLLDWSPADLESDIPNTRVSHDEGRSADLVRTPTGATITGIDKPVDVCFPVLHGTGGEDGVIQGFLESLAVPYVGSGVAASALCMNKHLAKPVLAAADVPVVPWLTVTMADLEDSLKRIIDRAEAEFEYPMFVKPSAQGSSVGVHKASDSDGLAKALLDSIRFDGVVLIEPAIVGKEVEIALLGNGDPIASVVGEIKPCNEFYDYEAKYLANSSELLIPAPLDTHTAASVAALAKQAFAALGCEGLARIDFFVDGDRIWCNEANTMPGFTPISMYPKLFAASDIEYSDLLDRLIALALDRHSRTTSNGVAPRSPSPA